MIVRREGRRKRKKGVSVLLCRVADLGGKSGWTEHGVLGGEDFEDYLGGSLKSYMM